ncbi:sensor histidine kinase [Ralstonia sp. RL]|uniref:sensor histidine kinase n=1 Tax=Ralstonia sp. RL TaxID=1839756 RepID=UPI00257DAF8F|nr:sensor histidine kinase [Ralstonia sp. RL]
MSSIRRSLLKWLIAPLLAINIGGAALTYWLAWIPAQIAFDQSLADAAWALIPHLRMVGSRIETDLSLQAEEVLRIDHFDAVYLMARDAAGKTILGDKDFPLPCLPEAANEPAVCDGAMRGEPVRVITLKTDIGSGEVLIGVAETLRKRHAIRSEIIVALIFLEGLLVAVSVAMIRFAVRKGLLPLRAMQEKLDSRRDDDLSTVAEQEAPTEVRPFVTAINKLLLRAQASARAQQDFLANVAHQLRTPLAGLKTQLEWLQQRHAGDADTARSASLMLSSTDRMIRQSNQLLALARAEPSQFEQNRLGLVALDKVVEESIQHFVQEADKKRIDIGFDLHPTRVMGDRFLLHDLIDNLIDNAVRYSPPGGMVTVSCYQTGAAGCLVVEDCGPGIPAQQRKKIFERHYRLDENLPGSGLGLAIVHDIVQDHGAAISIEPGSNGKGTVFRVEFPLPAAGETGR